MDKPLVSLATKDTAPREVVSSHLTAEEKDIQVVVTNVKERLAEGTTGFCDSLKKYQSKLLLTCKKLRCLLHRM